MSNGCTNCPEVDLTKDGSKLPENHPFVSKILFSHFKDCKEFGSFSIYRAEYYEKVEYREEISLRPETVMPP